MPGWVSAFLLMAILFGLTVFPNGTFAEVSPKYVLNLDIEELIKTEVTSVSRYEQLLLDAPAAVTIISEEDIHRSGFREMAEILRLVPGVQVARQSASQWFASARAFPDEGVNWMLVLCDGRSIYTQGVGRVYWSAQSLILEDIKQVEVIRGPGGTY